MHAPEMPLKPEAYTTGKSHCSSDAPRSMNSSNVRSMTQSGRAASRSILLTTTTTCEGAGMSESFVLVQLKCSKPRDPFIQGRDPCIPVQQPCSVTCVHAEALAALGTPTAQTVKHASAHIFASLTVSQAAVESRYSFETISLPFPHLLIERQGLAQHEASLWHGALHGVHEQQHTCAHSTCSELLDMPMQLRT
eukprot:1137345-Pelagomonas_calceolata.AAC.4